MSVRKRIYKDINGNIVLTMMLVLLCISITVLLGVEQYMFRVYDRYESACIEQRGSYISISWNDERNSKTIVDEIEKIISVDKVKKTEKKVVYVFFDSYKKMMQVYGKIKKYAEKNGLQVENETQTDIENIDVMQVVNKIVILMYIGIVVSGAVALYIVCRYWNKHHKKEQLLYYSLGMETKEIFTQNVIEILLIFFISVFIGYIAQCFLMKIWGSAIAQWYYALSSEAYLYTGNYEMYFTDQTYRSLTGKVWIPYYLPLCFIGSSLIVTALRREK